MKVTVKDCLKLSTFQKTKVLAGENNLINQMDKVSVNAFDNIQIAQFY